jgi:HlyD family secretion protein
VKKFIVFLIVLGLVGVGVAFWINRSRGVIVREDIFTYAPVEFGTLKDTVSATGAVKPKEVIAVGSELSGKVVEVYADVNDVVKPGAKLLKLDDRVAQLKLKQAQAAVKAADADIDRAVAAEKAAREAYDFEKDLVHKKINPPGTELRAKAQLGAATAGVKAARAKKHQAATAVDQAQLGVDLTIVRAPWPKGSGPTSKVFVAQSDQASPGSPDPAAKTRYVVLDRQVVQGQMIAPPISAQLFTLAADLGQMQVFAQVAEGDIAKVRKGLKVTFTVSAYAEEDYRFEGTVFQRRLNPTRVQTAVYYPTVINVTNPIDPDTGERRLSPGMTASVDIILREHRNVWKVPTSALNFQLDEPYQTEAARAKLAHWQQRSDRDDWKPLWVWDKKRNSPWPLFVRIGGKKGKETGIKDSQSNEVLEWEPGLEPKNPQNAPQVIINAPPAQKPGLFDQPSKIKFS